MQKKAEHNLDSAEIDAQAMERFHTTKVAKQPEPSHVKKTDVDLTHVLNCFWPGNPPNRTGNWYFDLNRLSLEPGQTGLIGNITVNFVFERADIHCITPVSSECRIEIFTDGITNKDERLNLGCFTLNSHSVTRETNGHYDLAGTYMGGHPLYIQPHDPLPDAGRIVINLVGYMIEPWR